MTLGRSIEVDSYIGFGTTIRFPQLEPVASQNERKTGHAPFLRTGCGLGGFPIGPGIRTHRFVAGSYLEPLGGGTRIDADRNSRDYPQSGGIFHHTHGACLGQSRHCFCDSGITPELALENFHALGDPMFPLAISPRCPGANVCFVPHGLGPCRYLRNLRCRFSSVGKPALRIQCRGAGDLGPSGSP